jgi:hypothetical protein
VVPILAVWLALVAGCTQPASPTDTLTILTDNGQMKAMLAAPAPGQQAVLSRDEALARAANVTSRADEASAVRARQALFTLEGLDGKLITEGRHAWLVTYEGVTYSASPGCTCYQTTTPNTTIALDARYGQVFLAYGSTS